MKSRMVCLVLTAATFATCFTISICIADDGSRPAIPSVKNLPAACRKARSEFRPLTRNDVDQAKTALIEALDRLNQRLSLAGPNGENWRKYLELAALQDELRRPEGPDLAVLGRIRSRYIAGHEGLDLVWFLDVQQTLQNFLATSAAVDNPKIRTDYEATMDKLAGSLETYVSSPTTEDALTISESVRFLERARQAPELVRAIQYHFVHANLWAEASVDVIGAGVAESVDDSMPVRDCILGTDIHGMAHTVGQIHTELSPHPNLGVLDAIFFGQTTSENVGYHGPVTIFSTGNTGLAARKRIWVDASGLSSYPATANAVTQVDIHDIQSNKGRRFVERMAWKRAGKQVGEAQCIASQHAEERLDERIDERTAEPLKRATNPTSTSSTAPSPSESSFRKSFALALRSGRSRFSGCKRAAASWRRRAILRPSSKGPTCRCGFTNRWSIIWPSTPWPAAPCLKRSCRRPSPTRSATSRTR